MSVRPHAWTAARVTVAVFCWLTAMYVFVASSTFASLQFLQPRVFSWVGLFSDWHAAGGWVALALVTGVCRHDIRRGQAAPRIAVPLVLTCGVAAAWNTMHPVLASLGGGSYSILIGVLALGPTIGLAALDHASAWAFLRRQTCAIDEPGFARSKDGCSSSRWARPCLRRPSTPGSPRSRSPEHSSPIS